MPEAVYRVFAQSQAFKVIFRGACGIQNVPVFIANHKEVFRLGALGDVSKLYQGVGKGEAPRGLVGPCSGVDRSTITTWWQTIDAVHFHRQRAKGDTPRGLDAVVGCAHLDAGGVQIAIVAHAPNQTRTGG